MNEEQLRIFDAFVTILTLIGFPAVGFFLHKIDIDGRKRNTKQAEEYNKTIELLKTSNQDLLNDFQRVRNDLSDLRSQMELERDQYQKAIKFLNEQLNKMGVKYDTLVTEHQTTEATIHMQHVYILRLQSYLKLMGLTEEQVIEITNGVNPNKEISK